MGLKEATDLFRRVGQADLAVALGVSLALVRQARLNLEATDHRKPPTDCRRGVIRLAERRIHEQRQLIDHLLDGV
jgi:hypothetical protein